MDARRLAEAAAVQSQPMGVAPVGDVSGLGDIGSCPFEFEAQENWFAVLGVRQSTLNCPCIHLLNAAETREAARAVLDDVDKSEFEVILTVPFHSDVLVSTNADRLRDPTATIAAVHAAADGKEDRERKSIAEKIEEGTTKDFPETVPETEASRLIEERKPLGRVAYDSGFVFAIRQDTRPDVDTPEPVIRILFYSTRREDTEAFSTGAAAPKLPLWSVRAGPTGQWLPVSRDTVFSQRRSLIMEAMRTGIIRDTKYTKSYRDALAEGRTEKQAIAIGMTSVGLMGPAAGEESESEPTSAAAAAE